jgi:putative ABC transport system permease protein
VRTFLTTLGVIIGVAAIITLLSIAFGFEESITASLENIGNVNQITVSGPRQGPGMFVRGGGSIAQSEIKILDEDAISEISELEGVVSVIPTLSINEEIEVGRYSTRTSMTGIESEYSDALNIIITKGRELRRNDKDVIIVGYGVDDNFQEKKTGKYIENLELIGKKAEIIATRNNTSGDDSEDTTETKSWRVTIIGIMEESGSENDYQVYIPLVLAEDIKKWELDAPDFLDDDGYDRLIVIVNDSSIVNTLVGEIEDLGYRAFSFLQIIESLNQTFVIIQIVLLGIGAIALIVAALGIINTMLMSIMERTREIGIMKVIGASNRDVIHIFLMEALGIGFLGGIGGVALGFVVANIVDMFAGMYITQQGASVQSIVSMPLWLVMFAIGFALLIGLVSGVYPAQKAAALSPVEALRHE